MDMTMIQGAIASLKTASDIVIGMSKLNTLAQVQAKSIELGQIIVAAQSATFSAHAAQSAMVEEVRTLKEEVVRVKAWESQKQRYKLSSPSTGSLVYALKESISNGEPPHWICTKCYEDGRKSILNPKEEGHSCLYVCPVCKSQIPSAYRSPSQAKYAQD